MPGSNQEGQGREITFKVIIYRSYDLLFIRLGAAADPELRTRFSEKQRPQMGLQVFLFSRDVQGVVEFHITGYPDNFPGRSDFPGAPGIDIRLHAHDRDSVEYRFKQRGDQLVVFYRLI